MEVACRHDAYIVIHHAHAAAAWSCVVVVIGVVIAIDAAIIDAFVAAILVIHSGVDCVRCTLLGVEY